MQRWILALCIAFIPMIANAGIVNESSIYAGLSKKIGTDESLTEDEMLFVIESSLEDHDPTLVRALSDRQHAETFAFMRELNLRPDPAEDPYMQEALAQGKNLFTAVERSSRGGPDVDSLPNCGGYWGHPDWKHERVEMTISWNWVLYSSGPNCAMYGYDWDSNGCPDCNPCGSPPDDWMVSFYFGRHQEDIYQLKEMLRWWHPWWFFRDWVRTADARIYEQYPGGGADNYNVYMCVSDWFSLDTIDDMRLLKKSLR